MGVKKSEKNPNYPKNRKARYYASPYNESLKIKDCFSVPETQKFVDSLYNACDQYCSTREESQTNGYRRILGLYILSLAKDYLLRILVIFKDGEQPLNALLLQ